MIPFYDLKACQMKYEKYIFEVTQRVIRSGYYILGPELERFEANFASYCGTKYAIGVGSGLDALKLTLRAWLEQHLLKPGDEVILPANTFIATALAITENNLTPILVEPHPNTFNIDVSKIEEKITDKTRVLLPVHLYGQLCNMEAILALAKKYNLLVLEDCAQAIGAYQNNEQKKAGCFGDAGAFSFYPTKNLGALGNGGAITTNCITLNETLRSLRNYGSHTPYKHLYQGFNSRLDEIQAAVLDFKLKFLDSENDKRMVLAKQYQKKIHNPLIFLPKSHHNKEHVWHLFVIKTQTRDLFKRYLQHKGIQTHIHYPIPIHQQQAYPALSIQQLPITEKMHQQILSLPLYPALSKKDQNYIIESVNHYIKELMI